MSETITANEIHIRNKVIDLLVANDMRYARMESRLMGLEKEIEEIKENSNETMGNK